MGASDLFASNELRLRGVATCGGTCCGQPGEGGAVGTEAESAVTPVCPRSHTQMFWARYGLADWVTLEMASPTVHDCDGARVGVAGRDGVGLFSVFGPSTDALPGGSLRIACDLSGTRVASSGTTGSDQLLSHG